MKVFNVNHIFRNVVILKIYSRKKIFTQILCTLKSFFSTQNIFLTHMGTSPVPVKGFKF